MENFSTFTEEQLIQAIYSGDDRALNYFFKKFRNSIYSFVSRFFKSYATRKDMTQDISINILEALREQRFVKRENQKITSWIFMVTRNYCIDQIRKNKKTKVVPIVSDIPDRSLISTDSKLLVNETNIELAKCVEQLKDNQKIVFRKRYYEGKSLMEINKEFGLNERHSTSRVNFSKAKKNIKKSNYFKEVA